MTRCALCEGTDLLVFVEREGVPVHQNIAYSSADEAQRVARGDLLLACCRTCGFIMNLAFRSSLLKYGEGYENDQTNSAAFEAHMDGVVRAMVASGVREKRLFEVGCGQGQFLRRLCAAGNNNGIGFDPAYVGPESLEGGQVAFKRSFYGSGASEAAPDVVVCRHVIEHVPSPLEFLENIRSALGGDQVTQLAFETPVVDWILDGTVVQDFFYEHCSYFTANSLGFAFERARFTDFEATRVFGEQYLWATASYRSKPSAARVAPLEPEPTVRAAEGYRARMAERLSSLGEGIQRLAKRGKVAVWGAGAKGVTFLNLLDPTCGLVEFAVDINPKKQGKFIAGTGHAIVSPNEVFARGVTSVLVMNPNYVGEVKQLLAGGGFTGQVHIENDLQN